MQREIDFEYIPLYPGEANLIERAWKRVNDEDIHETCGGLNEKALDIDTDYEYGNMIADALESYGGKNGLKHGTKQKKKLIARIRRAAKRIEEDEDY